MKKILVFAAILMTFLAGCASGTAEAPKLSLVYVSGNVTTTQEAAGRAASVTTRSVTGSSTKTPEYDGQLAPSQIQAGRDQGTVKLVFSNDVTQLKVFMTDGASGETTQLELEGDTITVEGGKSYGFTVQCTVAAGMSTFEMEYAFDLIYSPDVGQLENIEMPEPISSQTPEEPEAEPEESSEPEPEEEPETPTEETAEAQNYKEPPQLEVLYNGESIKPSMGTTSWNYTDANGIGTGYEADSVHPLQQRSYKTVTRIYNVDELYLTFPVRPDKIKVTYWKDTYADPEAELNGSWLSKIEAAAEYAEVASNGEVTFDTGYRTGYIYVVDVSWNEHTDEAGGTWSGSTEYVFALTETNY